MLDSEINEVLASLSAGDYGWVAAIPSKDVSFLGHPICLDFQTRQVPDEAIPPRPETQELDLAREILKALPQLIVIAEREFSEYSGEEGADPLLVRNPHIWISMTEFEDDGPGCWSFVVERTDAPDYGVHLEFDRLEFLECWGGD